MAAARTTYTISATKQSCLHMGHQQHKIKLQFAIHPYAKWYAGTK